MKQELPETLLAPWLNPFGSQQVSRIFLKNYVIDASIGVHDFEKERPQRLIVNADLYVAQRKSNEDHIDTVVDYDFLPRTIKALVARGHWHLQETFCEALMAQCLTQPGVLAARVSSQKPDVYPDCESVGYEIFRMKY
jgi:dihydroneopterin aldolase